MLDQLIESRRDPKPILRPATLAIAIGLHIVLLSGIYARYHSHVATVHQPSSSPTAPSAEPQAGQSDGTAHANADGVPSAGTRAAR